VWTPEPVATVSSSDRVPVASRMSEAELASALAGVHENGRTSKDDPKA
jgi:hypothetical protein